MQSGAAKVMDVLTRFQRAPRPLQDLCLDLAARMVVSCLWAKQADHMQRSSPTSGSRSASSADFYVLRQVEDELRHWSTAAWPPVQLLEQLLALAQNKVVALLGNGCVTESVQRSGPMSALCLLQSRNPAAVLLASLLEIFYQPQFQRCVLHQELQWTKESRLRVLHLINQKRSSVRQLTFHCYASLHYTWQRLPFSEKFVLTNVLGRFPQLLALHLPNVCDDDLLAKVGQCCPLLEQIDFSGSFGLTNQGIEWFCCGPGHPDLEARKKRSDELKRLRQVLLPGTSIDHRGLERVLRCCSCLIRVCVNDCVWSALFASFGETGDGCLECVGTNEHLTTFNMATNVASHLPHILYLFPNLRHLTVTGPGLGPDEERQLREHLPLFSQQTALTVRDVHLSSLESSLSVTGWRITSLCFSGRAVTLDVKLLSRVCPNMTCLSVMQSEIVIADLHEAATVREQHRRPFEMLTSCQLHDLQHNDHWKTLIRWTTRLQKLYLWNIVVTDQDFLSLMDSNPLRHLKDVRIGSSEIGFVRLTEITVLKLIRSCPDLRCVGGICDWKAGDLLGLLQRLLLEGGWKIRLEARAFDSWQTDAA